MVAAILSTSFLFSRYFDNLTLLIVVLAFPSSLSLSLLVLVVVKNWLTHCCYLSNKTYRFLSDELNVINFLLLGKKVAFCFYYAEIFALRRRHTSSRSIDIVWFSTRLSMLFIVVASTPKILVVDNYDDIVVDDVTGCLSFYLY